jgi:hypothetical protein
VDPVRVAVPDGISNVDRGGAAGATAFTTVVRQHSDPSRSTRRRGRVRARLVESLSPVHDDPSRLDYQAELGGRVGENADVVQGVAVDEDKVSVRSGLDHPDLT